MVPAAILRALSRDWSHLLINIDVNAPGAGNDKRAAGNY